MSGLEKLFNTGGTKDYTFDFKDVKVKVTTKEISWSVKNQILGDCFDLSSVGSAKFDFDKYSKKMLAAIIVSIVVGDSVVPPTELNEVFFNRLNPEFGSILEKLVPKAFDEVKGDFFVKGQSN